MCIRDSVWRGEITLRGEILPIGGLKEKLLAAHRGEIKTVLIPKDNEKDLSEIPKNIKQKLEIIPVQWIDEVLQVALVKMPEPLGDPEVVAAVEPEHKKSIQKSEPIQAH